MILMVYFNDLGEFPPSDRWGAFNVMDRRIIQFPIIVTDCSFHLPIHS